MCVKNNYETTKINLSFTLYYVWFIYLGDIYEAKYGKDGKSYMPGCCLLYKLLIIFLNGFIKNLES